MKQKALEYVDKDKVSVIEAKIEVAKADVQSYKDEKAILEKLKVALTASIGKQKKLKDVSVKYYEKAAEVQKLKAMVQKAESEEQQNNVKNV